MIDFESICRLLRALEDIETRDPPYLNKAKSQAILLTVTNWFNAHRRSIGHPSTNVVALLSSLLPHSRSDRVYSIQASRLTGIIGRCLSLSDIRRRDLSAWKEAGRGDLPSCVERVLKPHDAEPRPEAPQGTVSLEEVDVALEKLASLTKFSSKEVQASRYTGEAETTVGILKPLFLRLRSNEAKWLARLILKDFGPVVLDRQLVLRSYHFLLPSLLRFQDNFRAAVELLNGPLAEFNHTDNPQRQTEYRIDASKLLKPKIGIQVGRPDFQKAWSMKHCLNMVGKYSWVLERKYDGEYCEIHVDMSRGIHNCIQIFSKNGRDSTDDRRPVHQIIRECLRIGQKECKIRKKCILLAEMVVYSDKENRIMEFHKLRNHVSRGGRFLGIDKDSQVYDYEHLMLIFFDVLLLDDWQVMNSFHADRRRCLRTIVTDIPGRVMRSEYKFVDFSRRGSSQTLATQFASAILERHEGLVLKPADMEYFSLNFSSSGTRRGYFIKLKKDYMADMTDDRDVADLAVIGASFHAAQLKSRSKNIAWTTFHLGCVVHKECVETGAKPVFRAIEAIHQPHRIQEHDFVALNSFAKLRAIKVNENHTLDEWDLMQEDTPACQMDVTFRTPFVVEVLGSGYDKAPNTDFWMLRHPRIIKVHLDRDWKDCVSILELAEMAEQARTVQPETDSQMARLVRKMLAQPDRSGLISNTSETTCVTTPIASPRTPNSASSISRDDQQELTTPILNERSDQTGTALDITPPQMHDRPASSGNEENVPPSIPLSTNKSNAGRESTRSQELAEPNVDEPGRKDQRSFNPGKRARDEPGPRRTSARDSDLERDSRLCPVSRPPLKRARTEQPSAVDRPKIQPTISDLGPPRNPSKCSRRGQACELTGTIAYFLPQSAAAAEIESYLRFHGVCFTTSLLSWKRDCRLEKYPPLGDEVGESQSYPGHRKVVFVDMAHKEEARRMVNDVGRTVWNGKEEVEVYDWIGLVELRRYEGVEGPETMSKVALERAMLGRWSWDEDAKKLVWHNRQA